MAESVYWIAASRHEARKNEEEEATRQAGLAITDHAIVMAHVHGAPAALNALIGSYVNLALMAGVSPDRLSAALRKTAEDVPGIYELLRHQNDAGRA